MSGIMSMLLGARTAIAAAVDEFFNRVTLLLPGDGTNGAQNNTFLDSSTNNFTITRNGNTTQGTFSPFSQTGWSNYFDGSGDNIVTPSNSAFDPSGSNITVDCFVYLTRYPNANNIVFEVGASTAGDMQCNIINTGEVRFTVGGSTGSTISGFTLNTWHYITCVKSGTNFTVYLNGIAGTTVSLTVNSRTTMYIGSQSGGNNIDGYISNFRFVKGSANVPSGVPTAPLTNITNTSLLTCQSNRFVDNGTANSGSGFTLTINGNVSVLAFSPFAPTAAYSAATVGGSGYFDGTGDYLASATDAALVIGSGEFAIEWWEYRTTLRNVDTAIVLGNGTYGALLAYGDSNKPLFLLSTTGSSWNIFNSAPTLSTLAANQWTHFVVTRQSTGAGTSTFRVFVNGKLEIINTSGGSGTVYQPTNQIFVSGGVTGSSTPMQGYMSNVRVSIGAIPTAYQTSSTTVSATTVIFTPPTAPVTTTSQGATSGNVEYLLNFTNAGITDATAKNDLETVGNAQISTTQSKFGGSSMYFDGTGDYLIPNAATTDLYAFGTGDFTIEMWVYAASVTAVSLYDSRPSGTNGAYLQIAIVSGQLLLGLNNTAILQAGTISTNTWTHLAVSRSGTSLRGFINGTQVGSTVTNSTSLLNVAQRPVIGTNGNTVSIENFNGYMDDLRITKGYARYTANFTPPTAAFPLQ